MKQVINKIPLNPPKKYLLCNNHNVEFKKDKYIKTIFDNIKII